MESKIRVLFVCLGNICRSPMAEAVFAHKVHAAGLDEQIIVDSAGTGDWHVGETAHRGTQAVLKTHGINHDHRARQITRRDLDDFDYILTMDEQNFRAVAALGTGRGRVHRFLDYALHLGVREVPDPWFDGRFQHVYELVGQAADGLLAAVRKEHRI